MSYNREKPAPGTILHSTLRWNNTEWIEASNVRADNTSYTWLGQYLQIPVDLQNRLNWSSDTNTLLVGSVPTTWGAAPNSLSFGKDNLYTQTSRNTGTNSGHYTFTLGKNNFNALTVNEGNDSGRFNYIFGEDNLLSTTNINKGTSSGQYTLVWGRQNLQSVDSSINSGSDAFKNFFILGTNNVHAQLSINSGANTLGRGLILGHNNLYSASGHLNTTLNSGDTLILIGRSNMSTTTGDLNIGANSIVIGYVNHVYTSTISTVPATTVIGTGLIPGSYGETVIGTYNIPSSGSTTTFTSTDPVFTIGSGSSNISRSTAFQILRDNRIRFYTNTSLTGSAGEFRYNGTAFQYWDTGLSQWISFGGSLPPGTTPNSSLYWTGSAWAENTSVLLYPSGIIGLQSNNAPAGTVGQLRYNNSIPGIQFHDGSNWITLASGTSLGAGTLHDTLRWNGASWVPNASVKALDDGRIRLLSNTVSNAAGSIGELRYNVVPQFHNGTQWISLEPIPSGTTTLSTLHWSGTAWIENTSVKTLNDGRIRLLSNTVSNGAGSVGELRYNNSIPGIQFHDGTQWVQLATGSNPGLSTGTLHDTLRWNGTLWAASSFVQNTDTVFRITSTDISSQIGGSVAPVSAKFLFESDRGSIHIGGTATDTLRTPAQRGAFSVNLGYNNTAPGELVLAHGHSITLTNRYGLASGKDLSVNGTGSHAFGMDLQVGVSPLSCTISGTSVSIPGASVGDYSPGDEIQIYDITGGSDTIVYRTVLTALPGVSLTLTSAVSGTSGKIIPCKWGKTSFVSGQNISVKGTHSFGGGYGQTQILSTGNFNFIWTYKTLSGPLTDISSSNSILLGGQDSQITGNYASVYSSVDALASGQYSVVLGGTGLKTPVAYQYALGRFNLLHTGSASSWNTTEILVSLGNGLSDVSRSDILSIYKNGSLIHPQFRILYTTDPFYVSGGTALTYLQNTNTLISGTHLSYPTSTDAVQLNRYTESLGDVSFSSGLYTQASGTASFTGGKGIASRKIIASGDASFNWSTNTSAQTLSYGATGASSVILGGRDHHISSTGTYALVLGGEQHLVSGQNAVALGGAYSKADAYAQVVIGRYNINSGTSSSWISTDPLFTIGIGTGDLTRANGVQVYKNGILQTYSGRVYGIRTITSAGAILISDHLLYFNLSGYPVMNLPSSAPIGTHFKLLFNNTSAARVNPGTDTINGATGVYGSNAKRFNGNSYTLTKTGLTEWHLEAAGQNISVFETATGTYSVALTTLEYTKASTEVFPTNIAHYININNERVSTFNIELTPVSPLVLEYINPNELTSTKLSCMTKIRLTNNSGTTITLLNTLLTNGLRLDAASIILQPQSWAEFRFSNNNWWLENYKIYV